MRTTHFSSSREGSAQPLCRQTPLDADPPMLVMWPVMHAGKPTPLDAGHATFDAC